MHSVLATLRRASTFIACNSARRAPELSFVLGSDGEIPVETGIGTEEIFSLPKMAWIKLHFFELKPDA